MAVAIVNVLFEITLSSQSRSYTIAKIVGYYCVLFNEKK
jgi:hypothetical protein